MFSADDHILIVPADEGSVWPVYIPVLQEQKRRFILALTPENRGFFTHLFPGVEYVMLPSNGEKFSTFWPPGLFRTAQSWKMKKGLSAQGQQTDRLVSEKKITTVVVEARRVKLQNAAKKILMLSRPGKGKYFHSHPREYGFSRFYDETWMPDVTGEHKALGEGAVPAGTKYMGVPSISAAAENDIEFLVLLSGAEPYRTVLERLTWGNLLPYRRLVTVLRNTDLPVPGVEYSDNYTLHSFVDYATYISLIARAKYVICRPDPGIIMMLMRMGKQAIIIPGNARKTEQEFAEFHRDYRNFFVEDLHDLDIGRALSKMKYYRPVELGPDDISV